MWDELSIERAVSDDELVTAIARAMEIDRERITVVEAIGDTAASGVVVERRAHHGDFALYVTFFNVPDSIERVMFYRSFARELGCKLLVDDGDVCPFTAMLVTPRGESVRVNIDPLAQVITGLHSHVETDEVPDLLKPVTKTFAPTRGELLEHVVEDYMREGKLVAPRDPDAFAAAYTVDVQDAEHTLTELLRGLVHRKATTEEKLVLRRTSRVLRTAFADPEAAGGFIADILRCADFVLDGEWDPNAQGRATDL